MTVSGIHLTRSGGGISSVLLGKRVTYKTKIIFFTEYHWRDTTEDCKNAVV
jgi:hypothetical protein